MGVRLSQLGFVALFAVWFSAAAAQTGPLPSWNDGVAKQAILDFVRTTVGRSSQSYVRCGDVDRHAGG